MLLEEPPPVRIERRHVDPAFGERRERRSRIAERTDRFAIERRARDRPMSEQRMPRCVEARMRVLDGPADPMAERRSEHVERTVGAHEPHRAIRRTVAVGKRSHRRGQRLDVGVTRCERQTADEPENQIVARPKVGERRRRRMIDALDGKPRARCRSRHQRMPVPPDFRRRVVHPRARDEAH